MSLLSVWQPGAQYLLAVPRPWASLSPQVTAGNTKGPKERHVLCAMGAGGGGGNNCDLDYRLLPTCQAPR